MKYGHCKFGSLCKYHHPPEWSGTKAALILSAMGLPPDMHVFQLEVFVSSFCLVRPRIFAELMREEGEQVFLSHCIKYCTFRRSDMHATTILESLHNMVRQVCVQVWQRMTFHVQRMSETNSPYSLET